METEKQYTKDEFQIALSQFRGIQNYYKHYCCGIFCMRLSDGACFVKEYGNAEWLFNFIWSRQANPALFTEPFQVWKLEKQDDTWQVRCFDNEGRLLIREEIPCHEFPLDRIEIWQVDNVAMLSTEY